MTDEAFEEVQQLVVDIRDARGRAASHEADAIRWEARLKELLGEMRKDVAYQLALAVCGSLNNSVKIGDVSVSRTGQQRWAIMNHRTGVGNTGKSETEAARILVQMLGAKLPADPECHDKYVVKPATQ